MDNDELVRAVQAVLTDSLETGTGAEESLSAWRKRIDAIDQAILTLLNERSVCANRIGRIKKEMGLPVYVPSREEEVVRLTLESNAGPLPDRAVRRIYERIIDETRSLERQKYQDGEEQGDAG
jgi:chorismate mutase-like protein